MTPIPIPTPDAASAHFFGSLDHGRLDVLGCDSCGTVHLSVLTCDVCGGSDFTAAPAGGGGTLYSFTGVHIAHHPAFADRLPVWGGIIELDEGPRLFAPLLDAGPFIVGARVGLELLQFDGRAVAAFRLT